MDMQAGKDEDMNVTIEKKYRKLDRSKLKNRKRTIISSEEALKDVVPIDWSDEVLSGVQEASFTVRK